MRFINFLYLCVGAQGALYILISEISMDIEFAGLIGVIIGTLLTLFANYILSERQRKHELEKLKIEQLNERKVYLRGKYEKVVGLMLKAADTVNEAYFHQLNGGAPKNIEEEFINAGIEIETLIYVYFHELRDVSDEFSGELSNFRLKMQSSDFELSEAELRKLQAKHDELFCLVQTCANKYT